MPAESRPDPGLAFGDGHAKRVRENPLGSAIQHRRILLNARGDPRQVELREIAALELFERRAQALGRRVARALYAQVAQSELWAGSQVTQGAAAGKR